MKSKLLIMMVMVTGLGFGQIKFKDPVLCEMWDLFETQNYFKLKESFENHKTQLKEEYRLFYSAMIQKVFIQPESSNRDIEALLQHHKIEDELMFEVYTAKLWNHVNLYEYAEAAKASAIIQQKYLDFADEDEKENLKNEIKIWQALAQTPRQEVFKKSDNH